MLINTSCLVIVVVSFLTIISVNCEFPSSSSKYKKILSRQKRYLIFPTGSTVAVVLVGVKAIIYNYPRGYIWLGEINYLYPLPDKPRYPKKKPIMTMPKRKTLKISTKTNQPISIMNYDDTQSGSEWKINNNIENLSNFDDFGYRNWSFTPWHGHGLLHSQRNRKSIPIQVNKKIDDDVGEDEEEWHHKHAHQDRMDLYQHFENILKL